MQIARYEPRHPGTDTGASDHRHRATPTERVLEGELLRGDRREGRERRTTAPPADETPPLQTLRFVPPPPPPSGSSAIDAYLRAADPGRYAPASRMHLLA